jgi:hypothetical protein
LGKVFKIDMSPILKIFGAVPYLENLANTPQCERNIEKDSQNTT